MWKKHHDFVQVMTYDQGRREKLSSMGHRKYGYTVGSPPSLAFSVFPRTLSVALVILLFAWSLLKTLANLSDPIRLTNV